MNSFADCRLILLAILAFDFRFQISDSKFKIRNPKSAIQNRIGGRCEIRTRKRLLAAVFKTGALPIRLTFQKILDRRFSISDSSSIPKPKSQIQNRSKRRESNPQHLVWKTSTQPFEFRLQKISNFKFQIPNSKFQISNSKSEIWNVESEIQDALRRI